MNAAHLHMILVHIPVVLMPTACLLLAVAMWRKQTTVATVALSIFIGASTITVPAFLLGEDAEEIVEEIPGISEDTIEEHEEAADIALWLSVLVGATSLISLVIRNRVPQLQQATLKAILLSGIITSGALAYTAFEGGKIRHPEAHEKDASSGNHEHEDHEHH